MKRLAFTATLTALALAAPAHAEGDPEKGRAAFNQCQTCHVVVNEAGETLAGRNSKTGPNLYGVAGGPAGAVEGFRYGTGLKKANEMGLIWTEENFLAYVANPTPFLREFTGDRSARGNMSFQLRNEQTARDLYAFLESIGPERETE